MSPEIKKLPPELIQKIAAGEVVERPASIIKELLENSLDAQATQITVTVVEGGVALLEVADNGVGIDAESLPLAVERHTTSKVACFDDMYTLATYGFRGEALAAIAAVSDFVIESRSVNAEVGRRLHSTNGIWSSESVGRSPGTVVSVRDLFYSVPARKKFLKAPHTEYARIVDIVTRYAMLRTDVSWKLFNGASLVIDAPAVSEWKDRVAQLWGSQLAQQLVSVQHVDSSLSIRGFVAKPDAFRATKKFQYIYINGRAVEEFRIAKAVQDAYATSHDHGYPVFVLHLTLPLADVDVNVHPRKTEVALKSAKEVFAKVRAVIKATLLGRAGRDRVDLESFGVQNRGYVPVDDSGFVFAAPGSHPQIPSSSPAISLTEDDVRQTVSTLQFAEAVAKNQSDSQGSFHEHPHWKVLGQLHRSYLLIETPEGFMVLDQHAAAERLNYEALLKELASQVPASQQLLVPALLDVSHEEVHLMGEYASILGEIGFLVDSFGPQTISISAVPTSLSRLEPRALVKGILDDICEEGDQLASLEEARLRVVRYASCRGAIMFHDTLSMAEQQNLVSAVFELPVHKHTCCHGRPFMKEFLLTDLEKLFERH